MNTKPREFDLFIGEGDERRLIGQAMIAEIRENEFEAFVVTDRNQLTIALRTGSKHELEEMHYFQDGQPYKVSAEEVVR
jgi:hypothetical protein